MLIIGIHVRSPFFRIDFFKRPGAALAHAGSIGKALTGRRVAGRAACGRGCRPTGGRGERTAGAATRSHRGQAAGDPGMVLTRTLRPSRRFLKHFWGAFWRQIQLLCNELTNPQSHHVNVAPLPLAQEPLLRDVAALSTRLGACAA